jgi:hypothetical protein
MPRPMNRTAKVTEIILRLPTKAIANPVVQISPIIRVVIQYEGYEKKRCDRCETYALSYLCQILMGKSHVTGYLHLYPMGIIKFQFIRDATDGLEWYLTA